MNSKKLTIQSWNHEDKPRERFIEKGGESLTNVELLAILIRSGDRENNAIELSRKILDAANNRIGELKKFNLDDLLKFKGIGVGKALTIMSAFELMRRSELECEPSAPTIYSSKSVVNHIAPILRDITHEECWILYLNRGNRVIGKERISSGGISATVIDIKIIIKKTIAKLASSIILIHNHPSGNKMPGEQDKIQTQKLKKAAITCDIALLDHLIIAGRDYFSFLDEGLL